MSEQLPPTGPRAPSSRVRTCVMAATGCAALLGVLIVVVFATLAYLATSGTAP